MKVWQWSPMILQVEITLLFPTGRLHELPSWPKFLFLICSGYNPPAWKQLHSGCTVPPFLRIFNISWCFPNWNGSEWNFIFFSIGFHWQFSRWLSSKWQKQVVTFFPITCCDRFGFLGEEEFSFSQFSHGTQDLLHTGASLSFSKTLGTKADAAAACD